MLAQVLADIVCPTVCVCVSVTPRYWLNVGSRKQHHVIAQGLVLLTPTVVDRRPPFPLKFALIVTQPPFEHNDFDQYPLIAPQP